MSCNLVLIIAYLASPDDDVIYWCLSEDIFPRSVLLSLSPNLVHYTRGSLVMLKIGPPRTYLFVSLNFTQFFKAEIVSIEICPSARNIRISTFPTTEREPYLSI